MPARTATMTSWLSFRTKRPGRCRTATSPTEPFGDWELPRTSWYGHEVRSRSVFLLRPLFHPPSCEKASYSMPPDAVRAVDARAWLAKAAQDLRRVEILLAAEPSDVEGALFHSQQAAEKAIKGFLTWHDVPFRRVHEIDEIGKQCVGVDSSLTDLMGRADALTKYAWRLPYPGAVYQPTLTVGMSAFHP